MRIFGLIHRFSGTFPASKITPNSLEPNALFRSNFKGSIFYFNYKTSFLTFYQHFLQILQSHISFYIFKCKILFTINNFTKFYSFWPRKLLSYKTNPIFSPTLNTDKVFQKNVMKNSVAIKNELVFFLFTIYCDYRNTFFS